RVADTGALRIACAREEVSDVDQPEGGLLRIAVLLAPAGQVLEQAEGPADAPALQVLHGERAHPARSLHPFLVAGGPPQDRAQSVARLVQPVERNIEVSRGESDLVRRVALPGPNERRRGTLERLRGLRIALAGGFGVADIDQHLGFVV